MSPSFSLLCSALAAAGIWLMTSEVREPRLPDADSVIRYFGSPEEKRGISDVLIGDISSFLSEKIKLAPDRKVQLEHELEAAHLQVSPELYTAQNISMAGVVAVLSAVFGLLIWSGFFLAGPAAAVLVYRKQQNRAADERKRIEAAIDSCMPEFASFICSYVRVDHNVMEMLARYRARCSEPVLKQELDITLSDAGSSGIEAALIRFDARSHSPLLSSIVRALITLANGTYRVEHFEQLEAQFELHEKERLSKAAIDVPAKLKPYNFAIYAAFAVMLMVIFVTLFLRFSAQLL